MKRKDYDDDLLVELIARGDMTYARIGGRLGISESMARAIASGQARPDLLGRINAALRKGIIRLNRELREARRTLKGRLAIDEGARKKKQYDDGLLVELLGRGELPYRKIGEKVGLSFSLVERIARGECRADLQPRIAEAMRKQMAADRRKPAQARRKVLGYCGMDTPHRKKQYDDDLLVELIARGDMPRAKIARRVGLSRGSVQRIAAGLVRPELQPRIAAAVKGQRETAFRMGAAWLRGLLAQHIRDGIEGEGKHARKCREFAMTFIEKYGRFNEIPPFQPPRRPDLTDLSPELQKQVLEELGGPCEDWMFIDHSGAEAEEAAPLWPTGETRLDKPQGPGPAVPPTESILTVH